MKTVFYFIVFCYFSSILNTSIAQQVIQVEKIDKSYLIGKELLVFEDKSGKLELEDILKQKYQNKFQKQYKDVFTHASTKSAFWFKFKVENHSRKDILLEIDGGMWYIDLYRPDSLGKYTAPLRSGSLRPSTQGWFSWFWLPLSKAEDTTLKTCYMRLSGQTTIEVPIHIGTSEALYQKKSVNDILTAGFVGIMLIMFLYNFFIYLSTKDHVYLLYLGYILGATIAATFVGGYKFIAFLTEGFISVEQWNKHLITYTFMFPTFTGLFAVYYLHLYERMRWAYWLIIIQTIITGAIFPILNLFIDLIYLGNIHQVMFSSLMLSCVASGVVIWLQKDKTALFYVLGWACVLSAVTFYMLTINGIIPFSSISHHAMYFGVSAEVWLFSLALGNRLSVLRKENQKLIIEQNKVLEQKVQKRTFELQESNEELQVLNEELRQTQEEVQAQRDFVEEKNKELEKYNHKLQSSEQTLKKMNENVQQQNKKLEFSNLTINNSIKSAKTIQEALLPTQEKLDRSLKRYFLIYKPKDVVSGDFYWTTEEDNAIYLVASDCTGHGVPGAFMANMGITFLYSIIKQKKIYNPAEVLETLHQEVSVALKQGKTGNNSGMDLTILRIEKNEGIDKSKITFAGAKHNLLYFDKEKEELFELRGTRKSIGGIQNEHTKFKNQEFMLLEGSLIYLGSDGLEDQNNMKRKKFGKKRIKSIIQENHHLPLSKQKEAFEGALENHMESTLQRDDILWMGIKI